MGCMANTQWWIMNCRECVRQFPTQKYPRADRVEDRPKCSKCGNQELYIVK